MIIDMNKQEIITDIVEYTMNCGSFSVENLSRFILQGNVVNAVSKEQALIYIQQMYLIAAGLSEQIDATEEGIESYNCHRLFQYFFDRSAEVMYKMIVGKEEIDTTFDVREAWGYYELDIPEYLQVKITHIVGRLGVIFSSVYDYMKGKGYLSEPIAEWLPALLFSASALASRFMLEVDLDDESELYNFLME